MTVMRSKIKNMLLKCKQLYCVSMIIALLLPFLGLAATTANQPTELLPPLEAQNTFSSMAAPDQLGNVTTTNRAYEDNETSVSHHTTLLSFHFQSIPIRSLLQIIAKGSGYDFIISDAVKGDTTLSLTNVTWQKALNTVLATHNLTSRRQGGVVYITTVEEMTTNDTKKLQAAEALSALEPLSTAIISLKYTDAKLMAGLLKGQGGSNLLSPRGSVSVDPRTNSVVIYDTGKRIAVVKHTLHKLDVPAKQVLIEARIVNIDTTYESQLGIRFGVTKPRRFSGSMAGANQMLQGLTAPNVDPITDRLNFNLPANLLSDGSTPGSVGLALAKLGNIYLDLELSALESEGHIQIISKPRVVTTNQTKAVILTGQEIPYQEATSSGATSTSFKKAVLSLEVTPLITPDNKIVLKLKANQDTKGPELIVSPGTTTSSSSSSSSGSAGGTTTTVIPAVFGPPTINTQQVESSILLNNNETFVVGGIYQLSATDTVDRIPFFGSLPYIGALFRQKGSLYSKTELLIFITPKIIEQKPLDA